MNKLEKWFSTKSNLGLLIIRLFIGLRIIYGVFDNIISWDRMMEFSGFLKASGFPVPTFCAVLSVYAQFICGILILIGYKTRFAAFILVCNFIVAIVMVHLNDSIEAMTPALAMLFITVGLLFTGAGKWAIEKNIHLSK
jgi:putative oxidoreductase